MVMGERGGCAVKWTRNGRRRSKWAARRSESRGDVDLSLIDGFSGQDEIPTSVQTIQATRRCLRERPANEARYYRTGNDD